MSVKSCEKLDKSKVALTIEADAAAFEAAINKAYLKQRGKISGLAAYLSACGCEKIRLGVDKGNPQSHAFWTKNRFQTIGEARYIVMEREI